MKWQHPFIVPSLCPWTPCPDLCRLDGKCPKCPSYAWVLPLSMVLVAMLALAGAVYFNRKKLNIAGLSIGVCVVTCVVSPGSYDMMVYLCSHSACAVVVIRASCFSLFPFCRADRLHADPCHVFLLQLQVAIHCHWFVACVTPTAGQSPRSIPAFFSALAHDPSSSTQGSPCPPPPHPPATHCIVLSASLRLHQACTGRVLPCP